MDYLKYFDHAPTGKVPENQFQFNNDAAEIWKGVDRILFMDYVKDESGNWIPRGANKVQFINDFLDYHFSKYKGAPEEFFFTLRALIVEALSWGSKDQAINYLYSPIIEKWIKKMENMPHHKGFEKPKIEYLRRPVAFCVCLMYKAGECEISDMTKNSLIKFVNERFKDKTSENSIASAQKVVNTLLGYLPNTPKEKAFFEYDNHKKQWQFREDNFNYMIDHFPEEYKRALELLSKYK